MSQTIPDVALKRNKSERLPCVLIVDGSTSMHESGASKELQEGLSQLEHDLKEDDDTIDTVQIAIIRMGGADEVAVLTDFVDAGSFVAPQIEANGRTPLGMAVDHAMKMIDDQKRRYRENGISYKRPWLWIMSDGVPTDDWKTVAARARDAQASKQFTLWAVGIGPEADISILKNFTNGDRCFHLGTRSLKAMFEYMSASMSAGSRAAAGQQITLPPRPSDMVEM